MSSPLPRLAGRMFRHSSAALGMGILLLAESPCAGAQAPPQKIAAAHTPHDSARFRSVRARTAPSARRAVVATTWQQSLQQANDAYAEKAYNLYLDHLMQAQQQGLAHPRLLLSLARAYALLDRPAEALRELDRLAATGVSVQLAEEPDFAVLLRTPEGIAVSLRLKANATPLNASVEAGAIWESGLGASALLRDPQTGKWIVAAGRKRKVLLYAPVQRKATSLVDGPRAQLDGLRAPQDLALDESRRELWAVSADYSTPVPTTSLLQYDLGTGLLVRSYSLPGSAPSALTTLAVGPTRRFVLDALNNAVWTLDMATGLLTQVPGLEPFSRLEAMALSADERFLYLADHDLGLFRLDLRSAQLVRLQAAQPFGMAGITDLLYYQNSLIAVQGGLTPQRIVRFFLSTSTTAPQQVVSQQVLDSGSPLFANPALGFVQNGKLYYLAANVQELPADARAVAADAKAVILAVPLGARK